MPFLPSLPKGASLLDLFKAFPETSIPLIQFHEALLRRPSPFTEGERELIAAYVSGLNHCRYCHGVHSATAELLGIKRELVDSRIDIDGADVDPKMRPVLRYARKLTQHRAVRLKRTPTPSSRRVGRNPRFITRWPSRRSLTS